MKSINLDKVDKVNDLSRRVSKEHMSLEDLSYELSLIENKKPYPHNVTVLGACLSSIGFAYAFGGGLMEQLYAGMVGIIIRSLVIVFSGTSMDGFFKNIKSLKKLHIRCIPLLITNGYHLKTKAFRNGYEGIAILNGIFLVFDHIL